MHRPMPQARRSGFTLIELMAVMMVIIIVLSMGIPAMFAYERRSYMTAAVSKLIELHHRAERIQRQLATIGDAGVVRLTISGTYTPPSPPPFPLPPLVNGVPYVSGSPQATLDVMGGATGTKYNETISINEDSFIDAIVQPKDSQDVDHAAFAGSARTNSRSDFIWYYAKGSGFPTMNSSGLQILDKRIILEFRAMSGKLTTRFTLTTWGSAEWYAK